VLTTLNLHPVQLTHDFKRNIKTLTGFLNAIPFLKCNTGNPYFQLKLDADQKLILCNIYNGAAAPHWLIYRVSQDVIKSLLYEMKDKLSPEQ